MKAASLNHVYRLIWSKVQQAWVAVAEGTRTSGKSSLNGQVNDSKESGSRSALRAAFTSGTKWRVVIASAFAATLLPFSALADSNVVAGVVAGDLTIKDISATHTQYTHTANVNIVNFYKFGVLEGHQLDVVMPDAGRALYRVLGNSASEIMGKLNSNGSLFLINQNGILFGANSEVNVGNIVASTLNISNDDFLSGRYHFSGGDIGGSVINKGAIKAQDEGYIVMLGKTVENAGTLVANNGSVVLAAAKEAVLDFYGNGLVRANLTAQAVEGIVKNSGLIQANGGLVQLATNARSAAINITGIVEANQLVERDGVIRLEGGDNAKVQVSGKLLATGENTTGGTIAVTGEQVALLKGAVLDASGDKGGGTVLVGGDYQGKNDNVYNARTTYIDQGVTIKADAIQEGNGGKVIVWANDLTRYYGAISAQAGALRGNGGFVEVSGKQNLDFHGKVDVSAANGVGGILLLDPQNIFLNNSVQPAPTNNPNGTPDIAFADNAGGDTTVQILDVIGYSELFLQATNNINVDSALTMAGGSVRFVADNNININAALTTTIGGNIDLTAGNDVNVNALVTAGTGNINLDAGNNVNVNALVTTGFGNVTLAADNNVNVASDVTAALGVVTIKADDDNSGAGNIAQGADITGTGGVVLTGATMSHTAGNISSNGVFLGQAGGVTINIAGLATLGNANITAKGGTAVAAGLNGGNVNITAGSLNMDGNIDTSGSAAGVVGGEGGQGGKVTILATTGDAKVGNITTGAGSASTLSTISVSSGEVSVTSNAGDVNVGNINVKGGFNAKGANVALTAANGEVTAGNIDASAGTGRNNTSGKSAGKVDITAGTGITTQAINANGANGLGMNKSGGNAGAVTLNTTAGNINLGAVTVNSGTKTGGGSVGNAANILAQAGGDINVNGNVATNRGSVTLKADNDNSGAGNLAIGGNITGPGNVVLSGATLTHTAGDINANGTSLTTGNAGGVTITVTNLATLGTANITAQGGTSTAAGFNGGNVNITAGSVDMDGNINTSGSAGVAGNEGGQGGKVTVLATTGNAELGNITTGAGSAGSGTAISTSSGDVSVTSTAGNVTVGNINLKGGINAKGANVLLAAANGAVTAGNIDTSAGTGNNNTSGKSAGKVDINAGTGITTLAITANGANGRGANRSGGNAGAVTLKTTAGDIALGPVTVLAGAKTGGGTVGNSADVLAQAGRDVILNGNILSDSNAATAVQLVAGRNFLNNSNSGITTGAAGSWTVYSNDPTGDVKGSTLLADYDYKQYGTTFGGALLGTGNGFVHAVSPTVTATLNGTATKVFDGTNVVTDLSGLSITTSGVLDGDKVTITPTPITAATYDNAAVGAGKPIGSVYNVVSITTNEGKQIFNPTAALGYTVVTNSTATGTILAVPGAPFALGFASPRDDAGLGGLIPNNPALNTMTIVSLNPAAGDEEDLDAVACPVNEDSLGSTPILNSGVKLPDGVSSNCI
ncbi:two-partner secretion domain-containing protein [Methylophilus sp.]|uniref:two-partner secretion domain-containing protein n=1 Tax=Methylophilus sp. TaxID=29541 RepID=UPI004035F2DE